MPDQQALPPHHTPTATLPPMYAVATWLFALLLVGIFCLQSWHDWQRFDEQQVTEARRSTRFTAQFISRTIFEQRRMVRLFTDIHRQQIATLLADPNAGASFSEIHAAILRFLPTAFAFTLAAPSGSTLIDDFDGLVGEICQNNIRYFAQAGVEQPVFIHPHPEVYHYDLMERFGRHIFFVSFKPTEIASALRENASVGQQLFLLKGMTRLIEIGPEGTRLNLRRDIHLSAAEEAALLVRLPIKGTDWRLVALPDLNLIKQYRQRILWSLAARSTGILLLTGLALWLLRFESRRRQLAEAKAQNMERLSNTDALSGLLNRRALDDALLREWQWMERTGQPLTVMMIDVDHFKLYNDHHGHPQGDAAIRSVAEALTCVANRPRDIVGRFGGEEFLVLLPDTPEKSGPHLAEHMHEFIRNKALTHPTSPTSPVLSISLGLVCATPGLTGNPAQLLERVDQALYAAKASGRNRTVILSTAAPAAESVA